MRTPGTTKNFSPSRDVMVINCAFSGGPQPAFTKSRNCLGSAANHSRYFFIGTSTTWPFSTSASNSPGAHTSILRPLISSSASSSFSVGSRSPVWYPLSRSRASTATRVGKTFR